MRSHSTPTAAGPALLPPPAPLGSGPELFDGHPVERRVTLVVSGVRLEPRPVVPGDLDAIDRFVTGLSPRSRFLRFHAAVRRLTTAQLAGLVDVDHRQRETIVVLDPAAREVVALGQYVAVGPTTAELGIAVADDWQRAGLGATVVERLADAARAAGFRAFTASVLAENRGALALFERWPGSVRVERVGTAHEVLLCLDPVVPCDTDQAAPAAADALAAAVPSPA